MIGAVVLHLGDAEMVGRVALAVALGGAVGIEREISGQPAGFRTHVALALGAMLFGMVSVYAFGPFTAARADTNVQVDVSRVASQVAVGVGFLGAGAILKQGGSIRGLTTAASLWTTAAIGLAVGLGWYAAALAVTGALLVSLVGLRGVRSVVRRRLARDEELVVFRLIPGRHPGELVATLHEMPEVRVRNLRMEQDPDSRSTVVFATLSGVPRRRLGELLAPLADREDVEELYFQG